MLLTKKIFHAVIRFSLVPVTFALFESCTMTPVPETATRESISVPTSEAIASGVLRVVKVSTATQLISALKNAKAGDDIQVAKGIYTGNKSNSGDSSAFYFGSASGTSAHPILLESADTSNPATLQGNDAASAVVLRVTGDYWNIKNLKFTKAQKGLLLDNANAAYIYGCEIYGTGNEGLHFRDGSSNNKAEKCNIHDTGKVDKGYGEGVYVGSDNGVWSDYNKSCNNNVVLNCTIGPNVTAEHVDIKEGTVGTIVDGCTLNGTGISGANSADGFIDVKGNNAIIRNNTAYRHGNSKITDAFQMHQQVSGWGQHAQFTGNTVNLDTSSPYVVNAASGTSATASNNKRIPSGNMYSGNVN